MIDDALIEAVATDQLQRGISERAGEQELRAALARQGVEGFDQDVAVADVKLVRMALQRRDKLRKLQAEHDAALQQAINESE